MLGKGSSDNGNSVFRGFVGTPCQSKSGHLTTRELEGVLRRRSCAPSWTRLALAAASWGCQAFSPGDSPLARLLIERLGRTPYVDYVEYPGLTRHR